MILVTGSDKDTNLTLIDFLKILFSLNEKYYQKKKKLTIFYSLADIHNGAQVIDI